MLFEVGQFEHYFSEAELRRGLSLFERGVTEFAGKDDAGEHRFFAAREEVSFRKKGRSVVSWHCTCRKIIPCGHLASAMFVLQRGSLQLPGKTVMRRRQNSERKITGPNDPLDQFRKYCRHLGDLLLPDAATLSNGRPDVQAIAEKIRLAKAELVADNDRQQAEIFDLALVISMIPLYSKYPLSAVAALDPLQQEVLGRLRERYKKRGRVHPAAAWLAASLASLRNNQALYSPAFSFLVPRCLQLVTEHENFELLRSLLHKRKYPLSNITGFNPLTILKYQVLQLQHHCSGMSASAQHEPEYYIGLAELASIENKPAKMFSALLAGVEALGSQKHARLHDYLNYVIDCARENGRTDIEFSVLRQSLAHSVFIRSAELKRFIALAGPDRAAGEIEDLLGQLRPVEVGYNEKMMDLLAAAGKTEELIRMVGRQPERFMQLHGLLVKTAGVPDEQQLQVYFRHMLAALRKHDTLVIQQDIVDRARTYLERLGEERKERFFSDLMLQLGRNKPVYRYMEEVCLAPVNLPA